MAEPPGGLRAPGGAVPTQSGAESCSRSAGSNPRRIARWEAPSVVWRTAVAEPRARLQSRSGEQHEACGLRADLIRRVQGASPLHRAGLVTAGCGYAASGMPSRFVNSLCCEKLFSKHLSAGRWNYPSTLCKFPSGGGWMGRGGSRRGGQASVVIKDPARYKVSPRATWNRSHFRPRLVVGLG